MWWYVKSQNIRIEMKLACRTWVQPCMSSSVVSDLIAWFLPVHRYTTMGDSYGSVCVGLSVPVSVHHKCSIEMTERIELVFGMGASFHLSYTVLKGNSGNSKITVLPSETLSQTLDLENFAKAYQYHINQLPSVLLPTVLWRCWLGGL